ncbi:MAG TPA: hypothetical protein VGN15_05830 [Ktedonobacteraceae bacterium]|nr:hypothetical protein [Ktedonobacteraceae bacterium]
MFKQSQSNHNPEDDREEVPMATRTEIVSFTLDCDCFVIDLPPLSTDRMLC